MPRRDNNKRTSINHIVVTGYEKKKHPSKHYVFVIDIIWDNDERYEVLRRYSEFFSLNETLSLVLSKNSNSNTALPELPKRKFFGRSHVEKVAEARVESINKYCQGLIRLDSKISQSSHVIAFFSPKIGDRTLPKLRLHRPASLYPQKRPAGNTVWEEYCVIASFIGEGPNQMSVESGDQVRVVNKDNSGWWLVERKNKVGWIPESYLKKSSGTLRKEDFKEFLGLIDTETKSGDEGDSDSRESTPGIEVEAQDYKALDSYTATEPGQISFNQDDIITVLDKMEDGWWFVAKGKNEGWVPCGYLEPLSTDHEQEEDEEKISESAVPSELTEKYKTIAAYKADEDDEISFSAGSIAQVVYKSLTGWWMIKLDGKQGLAPATYLKKIEDDESSDSGVESGDGSLTSSLIQKSFKQSPRQNTVRKKRSQKKVPKNVPTITEEDEDERKPFGSSSPPRKSSAPPNVRPKPEVAPRKHSNPNSPNSTPKISPSSSPRLSTKPMATMGVNTPPRPRQTLINRAYATPKEEDEHVNRKEGLSPSRSDRQRSPSPVRRTNLQNNARVLNGGNEHLNGSNNGKVSSLDEQVNDHSSRGGNPYTQQAAESLIKYILASNDPDLKAALIKIVSSDSEIRKALKN